MAYQHQHHTQNVYSHVMPGLQHAAADKMDGVLARVPDKSISKLLANGANKA